MAAYSSFYFFSDAFCGIIYLLSSLVPGFSGSSDGMYSVNIKSLISSTFFERLQKDQEILTKQDRKKVVVAVADDIRENTRWLKVN